MRLAGNRDALKPSVPGRAPVACRMVGSSIITIPPSGIVLCALRALLCSGLSRGHPNRDVAMAMTADRAHSAIRSGSLARTDHFSETPGTDPTLRRGGPQGANGLVPFVIQRVDCAPAAHPFRFLGSLPLCSLSGSMTGRLLSLHGNFAGRTTCH